MEIKDGRQAIYAKTRSDWRHWLLENSQTEKAVWLILYHKKSKIESVLIAEAMEEALCFGWIDSKAKRRDEESFYLTFTPRNPKSKWSKINRDRAENLTRQGLMTEYGQKLIEIARATGKWEPAEAQKEQPE